MAKRSEHSVKPDSILEEISKKRFVPIYFLSGEEDWYFDLIIDEIINNAVDKNTRSFNFDFLYGSDITPENLFSLITSYPMMATRRVVIVKEFEKTIKSETKNEILEGYFNHPLESTLLVLSSNKVDGRKKIIQALKNNSVIVECNLLYDNEIPAWIRSRVKQKGKTISEDATRLLQANVGNKLRELDNAIEKLLLIVLDLPQIEMKHVESVIGVTREFSPHELTNAYGEKQLSRAFSITNFLINQGTSAVELIATTAIHFQKLLKLSSLISDGKSKDDLARAIRVHPYFLNQYQSQLKNYTQREIENALVELALADEKTKSISIADEKRTMIFLATSIIRGTNNFVNQ